MHTDLKRVSSCLRTSTVADLRSGVSPCPCDVGRIDVIKGQRAVRFPKDANLDTLAANGLTVGKTLCQVEKLFAPFKNGVIQCTLTGFFSDAEGVRLFDEEIAAFGKVLARRTQYIGKTKHISGVYDFVLALKDADNLPPFWVTCPYRSRRRRRRTQARFRDLRFGPHDQKTSNGAYSGCPA
ncbi:BQ2448_5557 [Microbotryum intermedium]|uniref:BQ2448_5557 protein n=1 Tax=Microbotryum intermedium TaxID=269621 RepID=A0A238F4G9_9BASI|nr:BQ2448_5557 [Microbotryum intermedium]